MTNPSATKSKFLVAFLAFFSTFYITNNLAFAALSDEAPQIDSKLPSVAITDAELPPDKAKAVQTDIAGRQDSAELKIKIKQKNPSSQTQAPAPRPTQTQAPAPRPTQTQAPAPRPTPSRTTPPADTTSSGS